MKTLLAAVAVLAGSIPFASGQTFPSRPVTLVVPIAADPLLIVASASVPARDLKELLAWLKSNPGKASAGTAGAGSASHVGGVYFRDATGTKFEFIPYRGTAPAMQDLVAGRIELMV